MMKSSMLVAGPQLDTYKYTMKEPETEESDDDDSFNYVIDLDYKSDESKTNLSHENDDNITDHRENADVMSSDQMEQRSSVVSNRAANGAEQKEDIIYNYTLDTDTSLNLTNDTTDQQFVNNRISPELSKHSNNSDHTFNEDSVLDLRNDKSVDDIKKDKEEVEKDDTAADNQGSSFQDEEQSFHHDIGSKDTEPAEGIIGALNKSDTNQQCNNKFSSDLQISYISKPVGASKRKRKFSLENAICNIMKVKTVCTRDIPFRSDRTSSEQSPTSSSALSVVSDLSMSSEHLSSQSLQRSSELQNPVVTSNAFNSSFGTPSIADMKSSSLLHTQAISSSPIPVPRPGTSCLTSSISSLYGSPSITAMKSSSLSYSPESAKSSPITSSKLSSMSHDLSSNFNDKVTPTPSSRRKSSAVFRANTFIGDSNKGGVLDMTIKKERAVQEPYNQMMCYSDEVIDLSTSSKTKNQVASKDESFHKGVPEPVDNITDSAPVDLSFKSGVTEDKATPRPDTEIPQKPEQLKVMDIFRDLLSQSGGGDGTVSMPQFIEWMQKTQPSVIENMNMMQISAYYMQFCYWMQTFFNNSLMAGLPNQIGGMKTPKQKRSRQRNNNRKSLPVPFSPNNSLSPAQNRDQIPVGYSIMHHPDEIQPVIKQEPTTTEHINDYNANHVKLENINFFSNCPELDALRERFECLVAQKDGKMKFLTKDNEQITTIVSSVLQVADLHPTEANGLETDENGLLPKFICRICGQKFFHKEHMSKHVKTGHVQKRFQCSQCERSFHDAGNYRQHIRVHDESDIPFECPECNRRFRHKCTLKVHMRIHTGEKPFKCDYCDASFKISSGLQTHMRKHTGETPYACEFCSLRFKCQSNLKQHMFQHTQARPFPCEICGKSYSRKSIRDSHLLTHYRSQQFVKDLNVTI